MLDEAKDEFDAILDYVHNNHGIRTERKVYDDILQRILQLDTMPELGTVDTNLQYQGNTVRVPHSKHTRIIYAIRDTEIVIVMLWNNQQDDRKMMAVLGKR